MIPDVAVRQPFAYDVDLVSEDTGLDCSGSEDKTMQSFKGDCDINALVKRFGITDVIPVARQIAEFGEFDLTADMHTLMNQVRRGESAFQELPAEWREKFGNDPVDFLDALHNPERHAELVSAGIVKAPEAPVAVTEVAASGEGAS